MALSTNRGVEAGCANNCGNAPGADQNELVKGTIVVQVPWPVNKEVFVQQVAPNYIDIRMDVTVRVIHIEKTTTSPLSELSQR